MSKMRGSFVALLAIFGFILVLPNEASKEGYSILSGGRIVGGRNADHSEFPFMVTIQRLRDGSEWRQHCGGSIVSSKVVLTACHCICKVVTMNPLIVLDPSVLRVVAGVGNINDNTKRQVAQAQRLIPHPQCKNSPEFPYFADSAVLILQKPLVFNPEVQPLNVFSNNVTTSAAQLLKLQDKGATCTVAGWGKTAMDQTEYGPELQIAEVKLMSTEKCHSTYCQLGVSKYCHRDFSALKQFCAIGSNRSAICFADSGGPLICSGFVYGVVSYGSSKCSVDWPGIFSNVEVILEMINILGAQPNHGVDQWIQTSGKIQQV